MAELFSEEFIKSLGALSQAVAQQQDCAAAMLYRLMFRHERNIHVLDRHADTVLEGISGMGSQYAAEDYRNYLQYLKTVLPEEVPAHQALYDEEIHLLEQDRLEAEVFEEEDTEDEITGERNR